jgi:hypothetical protein
MNDFLKYVIPFKQKFISVKVTSLFIEKVKETVLDQLSLKNLNHLRDKFEGVAFYEKVLNFLFGLSVLENHLLCSIIDWKNVKQKKLRSNLALLNLNVDVVTFRMGELPMLDKRSDRPVIFVLRRNEKNGWICGIASLKILNSTENQQELSSSGVNKQKVHFTNFDKLKLFSNLNELKSLLKAEELTKV